MSIVAWLKRSDRGGASTTKTSSKKFARTWHGRIR